MNLEVRARGSGRVEVAPAVLRDPDSGEVRVRVSRCGICGSDLHWFRGSLDRPAVCPGHEISGTVETIGTGVSGWREGDRVTVEPLARCGACTHCKRGDYQLCSKLGIHGVTLPGGMATTVVVPAYSLHRLPDRVDLALGALAEPLAVGVHALRLTGLVRDEPVVILGAGTIGLLTAVAAQQLGAGPVTITARYAKQAEAAKALGVDRVVDPDQARETRPRPRAVVETVGGHAATLSDAVACVARGGTIAMVGLFETPPAFDPMQLLAKEARIVGSSMYSRRPGSAGDFDLALETLADRGEALRPLLTHTFPLSEAQRAFETACDKSRGALKVTLAPDLAA